MAARPGAGMRIMGVREAADTPDALKGPGPAPPA